MPHLSPMSWATAPLIFWVLLFIFISLFWWFQPTKFPKTSSPHPKPQTNNWPWQ